MSGKAINLVTFHSSNNFGSNLQAIALSRVLAGMGYDVSFLERFSVKSFLLRHPVLLYARVFNKLGQKRSKKFFSPVPYSITDTRKKRLAAFHQKYFKPVSYTTGEEWKKAIERKTVFAAGSDILWNPAKGYPGKWFLDFAYYAKLPRFSYGSSIGALELPHKYYRAYRRYLGTMAEVGVREQSVADMLEPIIHRKVTRVVDPTLLLEKEDWDRFCVNAELSVPVSRDGFILCYFVMHDPRYWEYVRKVKEATGKQVIVLPMHELDEQQPYDIVTDGTPYEFVWLIKNADFICTDSFHACAISLVYRKEFYLLRRARKSEDAKYDDFLGRYNLKDRAITDETVFTRKQEIDYESVGKQLKEDRAESMAFLKKTLQKCGG